MKKLVSFLNVFRLAFSNLKANDPVRMAGATAFFAFFALPPIVIILSQILSTLFDDRYQSVSGRLFGQLAQLFGPQSARQLQDITQHLQSQKPDRLLTIVNVGVLLLTSTTLFAVIKSSLNQLWNVKAKPDRTWLHSLEDRLIALVIIFGSGLLVTASLTISQALAVPGSAPDDDSVTWAGLINGIGRYGVSVLVLTVWFAMLLTYLPDVRVRWSATWVGALVTAGLFTAGEWVLTRLLTYSLFRSMHGGAATITLILLLVFYCSLIFYFGASFTRQYAEGANLKMTPNANAVGYTIAEVKGPVSEPDDQ